MKLNAGAFLLLHGVSCSNSWALFPLSQEGVLCLVGAVRQRKTHACTTCTCPWAVGSTMHAICCKIPCVAAGDPNAVAQLHH